MSKHLRPRSLRVLRWALPALLLTVLVLPKGFAEPRDGWSLEARVPPTALGFVSIEDIGGMEARFEKTAIAGLFREPEMKAFVAPIEKAGREMLEAGEDGPLGESGPMVLKVLEQLKGLKGQVAIALLDVDVDAEKPEIVASLDFGPHVADFITFVQTTRAEIDPEGEAKVCGTPLSKAAPIPWFRKLNRPSSRKATMGKRRRGGRKGTQRDGRE